MEICPACGRALVPFRAKLVCRTPGCGFSESCCDGGWMHRGGERPLSADEPIEGTKEDASAQVPGYRKR